MTYKQATFLWREITDRDTLWKIILLIDSPALATENPHASVSTFLREWADALEQTPIIKTKRRRKGSNDGLPA